MVQRSNSRPLGFTLFEALVCVLMVSFTLMAISSLVKGAYDTLKFSQKKDRTIADASAGLDRIVREMREATDLINLAPLTFQKVNPTLPLFKEGAPNDPAGNPLIVPWERYDPADKVTVSYNVVNGNLMRTVGAFNAVVVEGVNTFTVTPDATVTGVYEVTLTVLE
ncbi:MAG: hypothetical protein KC910_12555, partial [Candidatus Eremiobacteraeota bacterium]|nr:hypothetical protein [Candidatus Eremiobacteraeota bacterium]